MSKGTAANQGLPEVRVIASPNRHRTVAARMVDGVVEVRVPARMSEEQRQRWVEEMRGRLTRRAQRSRTERELEQRADRLNRCYFEGRLLWSSIGWAEQRQRWGSCSPLSGGIRISSRAARLPDWVLDYLLMHELAHLLEGHHGPRFWELVNGYPLTERARGYLMAVDHSNDECS
jgi:predicted metal-dependent hydrolase